MHGTQAMRPVWPLIIAVVSALPIVAAQRSTPGVVWAPSGEVCAVVIDTEPPVSESRLKIRNRVGEVLFTRNFASPDGNHGLEITNAQWTPNSQYFVFSGNSSGGHQPWQAPTFFYSRASNALYDIAGCVGPVTPAVAFQLKAPDVVVLAILVRTPEGYSDKSVATSLSLSALERQCTHE